MPRREVVDTAVITAHGGDADAELGDERLERRRWNPTVGLDDAELFSAAAGFRVALISTGAVEGGRVRPVTSALDWSWAQEAVSSKSEAGAAARMSRRYRCRTTRELRLCVET